MYKRLTCQFLRHIKIRRKSLNMSTTSDQMEFLNNKEIFPDFKVGPLTAYRNKSSFDFKKLKIIIEDQQALELRHKVWSFMETNPEFARSPRELNLDELRHEANRRMLTVFNENFFGFEMYLERPELLVKYSSSIFAFDSSLAVKTGLAFGMFPAVLRSLGTDRLQKYVFDNQDMKNIGCFALTEIAHGTNVKGMRTTAKFDSISGDLILHTPDFEAAKCWVGNLGKTATHAIVYAQLYDVNGEHHGMNAFLVPIRDTKTMLPYSGVTVGDLGAKVGLNGLDNGFVLFDNYHISREMLLSRSGDITVDGKFVSQIKDKNQRFGSSLGALSAGRVGICEIACTYITKAITIAVRYAAARKQFGPDDSDIEYPVLEYQAQQYRLLPHLATTFAGKIFSNWLNKVLGDMTIKNLMGEKGDPNLAIEMHALSSAAKPVLTWLVRDAIQECREACGGHGYLKVARFGDLRNDNDGNLTYEGENNVLIQQASNWLLRFAKNPEEVATKSPLHSASFLNHSKEIRKMQFKWNKPECAVKPENLLIAFDWICVFLLEQAAKRVQEMKDEGKSNFEVRNDSQVFGANTLSIAYGHRALFNVFFDRTKELPAGPEREVLTKLVSLFGANLIVQRYIGLLYQGGFIVNDSNSKHTAAELYQTGILNLLPIIKDESISLVDSIAYPDFINNSPLGMSDGEIYKNLQNSIYQDEGVFERPVWYKDIVHNETYIKPKL